MSTPAVKKLPGSLAANPRLSRWIKIQPDGRVRITPGKVEIGQGISTALAQIAADELDVDIARLEMVRASTAFSPDEGVTSGSLSVQDSGSALRWACAEARAILLAKAADKLGVPVADLRVEDGTIRGPGNAATSYWELADDRLLDRDATAGVPPKPVAARTIAGRPVPRSDIPDKVFGRRRFLHDMAMDGMLHGRVLRPTRQGATLVSLDDAAARVVAGVVAVVRDGSFVGIVAETEQAALRGIAALAKGARWDGGETPPPNDDYADWLQAQPVETTVADERKPQAALPPVSRTVRRRFAKPYIAHASIGPSIAIAQWNDGSLAVWCHSQGIYNLRTALSVTFAMPVERIVVAHVEGSGCYGHNPADDVGLDAALLARAVPGRPVRMQWTRAEELGWGPLTPAMAVSIEADLDASGEIIGWRHDIWSNGHSSRPGRSKVPTLLAASQLEKAFPREPSVNPPLAGGGGAERNAIPAYDFPAWTITSHRLLTMPVRTSAMRSLGAFANVFAIESMVDEIARTWGEDPVAWRLRHLPDPRARAVVEAAAARAGWSAWQPREGKGHGIGYARYKHMGAYCAVVAEIEAAEKVRITRLVAAVDVGETINPDGIVNQTEGGCIQAASWTLLEAVRFEDGRVGTDSWETYPILKFSEVPAVEVVLLDRPGERALGGGEHAMGPVAGAIANAVYDALGVRVTQLPITPERIVAAMEA